MKRCMHLAESVLSALASAGLSLAALMLSPTIATAGPPPVNDQCFSATLLTCDVIVQGDLTDATIDISDPLLSCYFGGPNQGAANVWYKFVAPLSGEVQVRTCATTFSNADSLIALYSGACYNLVELCCSEDDCGSTGLLSEFCCRGLIPGETYHLQLACFADANRGIYDLELLCVCEDTGPAVCPWECPSGALLENEANCGLPADTTNGGCGSTPFRDIPINCGETWCGTHAAADGYRDSDWYQLCIPVATTVTITLTVDVGSYAYIAEIPAGCGSVVLRTGAHVDACDTVTITDCLSHGCYWLVILPDTFFDVPCESRYMFTVECAPPDYGACCIDGVCTNNVSECDCVNNGGIFYAGQTCTDVGDRCGCDVVCPPNANVVEFEPGCGIPVDTTNGGCTGPFVHFGSIHCGDILCGTYGAAGGVRDTDAYWINIVGTKIVTVTLTGELPSRLWVRGPGSLSDPCDIQDLGAMRDAEPCETVSIVQTLTTGWYLIAVEVAASVTNVGCPFDYVLTVQCEDVDRLPGDVNCDDLVDFFDIDGFLLALFDPAGYAAAYPGCGNADANGDGTVDFFDIDAFLACLFGACP